MKNKTLLLIILIFIIALPNLSSQTFNKSTDLLLANFDFLGDDDDVQASAALGCILKHPDYDSINYFATAGAYGAQDGFTFIHTVAPEFFTLLFGSENVKWTNADKDWDGSVERATEKVVAVLNAGGKVFVQEGGQSDFTYDVCQAAIAEGIPAATIKTNVIVVQHSNWNTNNTTGSKKDWITGGNVVYVKIADGNTADNGSPAYKEYDTQWMPLALAEDNPNEYAQAYWTMADAICDAWTVYNNPAIKVGGVDFSDCAENWYIFNWGTDGMTVASFWEMFVTNDLGDADFAPVLSFVSPSDLQYFDIGANVAVELTASDDNSISNLKLFLDGTLISQKDAAPYDWSTDAAFQNMAEGTYVLRAVAEDDAGQTAEVSATITVREAKEVSAGPTVGSNFIVCEMENTNSDLGKWELITPGNPKYFAPEGKIAPIGNTHVEFTGNNPAGSGSDRSPLDYTFVCPKTAQYELYMRMHQRLDGQATDRCNDVYIKMAGNFTSGHALISTEQLKEEQKFFGKGTNWGVGYRIDMYVDGEEKRFPARYNLIEGEEYTFTIAGRSKQTNLDYWILIDNTEDFAPVAQNDMAEMYDAKYQPSAIITDTVFVNGITVSPDSLSLPYIGKTGQLTATLSPSNVSFPTIVWSSSNDTIVSVTQDGLVKAIGPGTVVIKAISEDGGFVDSCVVSSLDEAKPEVVISGYYQMLKSNGQTVCLYAADDAISGGDVSLFTYTPNDTSTVWTELDHGDGYYSYQKYNTTLCLDGSDGGANSQPVLIAEFDKDNKNQHWSKEVLASGNIRLKKRDVEFVLNSGASATVGQKVNLWKSSSASANLQWVFVPAFEGTAGLATEFDRMVKVYPNPASEMLTIECSSAEKAIIKIINTSGVVVLSTETQGEFTDVDISRISTGYYMLQVINGHDSYLRKIIVK